VTRPLVFHPDVADEVDETYRWYEGRQPDLGDDFLAALEAVYRAIAATPEMHQLIEGEVRRSVLRRFPYCVYYRARPERVEVIAVQHGRRHPDGWRDRL
jgi:plasmid stabilization system protein ParE